MAFLRLLESIRTPWLDTVMSYVTYLGSEAVFLLLALLVFWCVNKREGYYLLTVGFFGTMLNQFMKLFFRIPRPWVLDEKFTIVEAARGDAGGYSFPSGHTQSAGGTFGGIACWTRRKGLRVLCILLAVLVAFSRMYLGVHTPLDVGVAAVMAVALVLLLRPLFLREKRGGGEFYGLFFVMLLCTLLFLAYVTWFPFPADIDGENLAAGVKNAWTLFGAVAGVQLVYWLDDRFIGFDTQAVWWAQLLKLALGLALVLAVKSGLKAPLLALCGGHPAAHALRYFLVVLLAGGVWPLSFPLFAKLGRKR